MSTAIFNGLPYEPSNHAGILYCEMLTTPVPSWTYNTQYAVTPMPGNTGPFLSNTVIDILGNGQPIISATFLIPDSQLLSYVQYHAALWDFTPVGDPVIHSPSDPTRTVLITRLQTGSWSWGTAVIDPTAGPPLTVTGRLFEVQMDLLMLTPT